MNKILWLTLLLIFSAASSAGQFRQILPIVTPEQMGDEERLNLLRYSLLPIFDRNNITEAVHQIAVAWGTGELGDWLSNNFLNRQRLLSTLTLDLPRDARIRILGIRGQRVTAQQVRPSDEGILRTTFAIALVQTQIEFTDPSQGFQRLTADVELALQFEERFE
ncbi:MAG: hypothetical protein ABW185_09420 [Sedimenticola sp.]